MRTVAAIINFHRMIGATTDAEMLAVVSDLDCGELDCESELEDELESGVGSASGVELESGFESESKVEPDAEPDCREASERQFEETTEISAPLRF